MKLIRIAVLSCLPFATTTALSASDKLLFEVDATYVMNDADSKLTAKEALNSSIQEKVSIEAEKEIKTNSKFIKMNSLLKNKDLAYIVSTISKITPISTGFSVNINGEQIATQKSKVIVDTGAVKRYAEVMGEESTKKVSMLEHSQKIIQQDIKEVNKSLSKPSTDDEKLSLIEKRNRLFLDLKLNKTALQQAIDDAYLANKSPEEYKKFETFYIKTRTDFKDRFQNHAELIQYNKALKRLPHSKKYQMDIDVQWRIDIPSYTEEVSKNFKTLENRVVNQDDIALMVWPNNDGDFVKDKMFEHLVSQTVYLNVEIGPYHKKVQIAGPKAKWDDPEFISYNEAKEKGFNVIYFAYTKGIEKGKAMRHVVLKDISERYINKLPKIYLTVD